MCRWFIAIIFIANYAVNSAAVAQNAPKNALSEPQKRYQACTTCHGAGSSATVGRTANEMYFPRIAGKPAAYLYNQLRNYRDGKRHYGLMVGLVEYQSDAALMAMAQYFSSLDLPYPEPAAAPASSAASLPRGEQLVRQGDAAKGVAACTSCHGAMLSGQLPAIPGLLGLPRDYIVGQLGAWQTGQRQAQAPDCMARVAQQLSPQDVSAVATWLASQRVPQPYKAVVSTTPLPMPCGATNSFSPGESKPTNSLSPGERAGVRATAR